MTQTIKNTLKTVYIVFLHIIAGFAITAAANDKLLITAAVPFAIALILALRFLGLKPELIAWAAFTGWLGSTYLTTGNPIEYGLFLVYIVLAGLGVFKSPYFIAIAWLIHPIWDFVPRELPELLHDLPVACILFDIPIGLYLLWGARTRRWATFGNQDTVETWYQFKNKQSLRPIANMIYVIVVMGIISYAVLMAAARGWLIWAAIPLSLLLIFMNRVITNKAELLAWAAFTGWLGMTYAHTGGMIDAVVFFIYVALAALGVFRSTYFLAFAWLIFIPWNFLPHELPHMYGDLPVAATLFGIPITLYLFLGARNQRWSLPGSSSDTHAKHALVEPV